jgi:hypothetical protein
VVLTTEHLDEIQLVADLGQYVLGARFPDGVIRIATCTIDHVYVSLAYGGVSSLEHTLVHEIGHGIQMGKNGGSFTQNGSGGVEIHPGDPRCNFDEFVKISGWSLVDPARYHSSNLGQSVNLDGVELPLEVPVQHQGKGIILSFYGGKLFAHDAFSPFSLVPYSRTSPWEDWAEAFAEYYLKPDRLIIFAPEKYEFMEQEYRKYEDRADLKELLEKSFRSRGRSSEPVSGSNIAQVEMIDGELVVWFEKLK